LKTKRIGIKEIGEVRVPAPGPLDVCTTTSTTVERTSVRPSRKPIPIVLGWVARSPNLRKGDLMRKILVTVGLVLAALAVTASPVSAHGGGGDSGRHGDENKGSWDKKGNGHGHWKRGHRGHGSGKTFRCDGVFTGVKLKNVFVPPNGSCTLTNSRVRRDVFVAQEGFFQATNTRIRGDVKAWKALTVFIDTGSTVGDDVSAGRTHQVFVFGATVFGAVRVEQSDDKVQVCGSDIGDDLKIKRSGRDILVGDPLAVACAGNNVDGDVKIAENVVDVEITVRGNTIGEDMRVLGNTGTAAKFVENNVGGDTLSCQGNDPPFTASGNTGWIQTEGQCATP
jgi:hypothetical protein